MALERFIESFDGTRIFTRTVGEGPPLILCDGLGCDGFIWLYLEPFLANRFKVIHWNYRGHGRSEHPKDPEAYGVPALRDDLLAVLDAYNIKDGILVGHSMGVQVILDFAIQYPERTRALIPICGSYANPIGTFHNNGILDTVFPLLALFVKQWPEIAQFAWGNFLRSELGYWYAATFEVTGRLVNRADFAPYFERMSAMDVRFFARLVGKLQQHDLEERLNEIDKPTLIIAGDSDTFTPGWLSAKMHSLISGSELLMVPFGSHIAPLEMPELIHLRIKKFLDECQCGRRTPRRPKRVTRVRGRTIIRKKAGHKKVAAQKTAAQKTAAQKTLGENAEAKKTASKKAVRKKTVRKKAVRKKAVRKNIGDSKAQESE